MHVTACLDHRLDTYLATDPLSQLLFMQIMYVYVCLPSLEKNLSPEGFKLPFVL